VSVNQFGLGGVCPSQYKMTGTYKTCTSDSCVILAKYKPASRISMNLATQRVSFLIYREAVNGENTKEVNVCACVGKQELDAVHSRCSRLPGPCRQLQDPTEINSLVHVGSRIWKAKHYCQKMDKLSPKSCLF